MFTFGIEKKKTEKKNWNPSLLMTMKQRTDGTEILKGDMVDI